MSDQTRADLETAIRAHAADEWDGDLPVDWVIVAALIGDDGHTIGVQVSREPMPNYITVGLLTEGLRLTEPEED